MGLIFIFILDVVFFYIDTDMEISPVCPICKRDVSSCAERTTALTKDGIDSLNSAASKRGDAFFDVAIGQKVHESCRRPYTSSNVIKSQNKPSSSTNECKRPRPSLRSDGTYKPTAECLYCAKLINKKAKSKNWVKVETLAFQQSLRMKIRERNDEWAVSVLGRLNADPDSFATEMLYHKVCDASFRMGQSIPQRYADADSESTSSKKPKLGRSIDKERESAFDSSVDLLTSPDDRVLTLGDLAQHMGFLLGDANEAYSKVHIKNLLEKRFPGEVLISTQDGKPDVITLQKNVSGILREFHAANRSNTDESEKERIISAAASLIFTDIKETAKQKGMVYPTPNEIGSEEKNKEFLPETLNLFLRKLIHSAKSSVKISAIGQAIMQACRPRTLIAPLQIGSAVQMHHLFSSRLLVDTINSLGFCSSYTEVQRFLRNAAIDENIGDFSFIDNQVCFVHFVGDNVDVFIDTLDGGGSFHGMGLIVVFTPGDETHSNVRVERNNPKMEDVIKAAHIEIKDSLPLDKTMPGIRFIVDLSERVEVEDKWEMLHFLWAFCRPLTGVPTYSAFMSAALHKETHPGVSSIRFLPTIDLAPTDPTCILSTLTYVHAMSQGRFTPVLTFDQPLYVKAVDIIANQPPDSPLRQILLRLGPFHIMMSFLASIGHIMAGSGLKDALETVYGENVASNILSGKTVARSVRANSIIKSGLLGHLIDHLVNQVSDDTNDLDSLKQKAIDLITDLMHDKKTVDEVVKSTHLECLRENSKI